MVTYEQVNLDIALTAADHKNNFESSKRHKDNLDLGDKLGLTHLELIRVLVNLEDKYNVVIPQEKIESMTTLDDLVETVVEKAKGNNKV